jgi:hypothetical protein
MNLGGREKHKQCKIKSEVSFKQLIHDLQTVVRSQSTLPTPTFEVKLKKHDITDEVMRHVSL